MESLIIAEIVKHYYHAGSRPQHVYFWRDQVGHELDCIIQKGNDLVPIEIKASITTTASFFEGLNFWAGLTKNIYPSGYVIYGGLKNQRRSQGMLVSWQDVEMIFQAP